MKGITYEVRKIITSRWLPWSLMGITLLVALLHEVFQPTWISDLPRVGQAAIWALGLSGLVIGYLVISRFVEFLNQRELLDRRAKDAEELVTEAYQRLDAVYRVSQKFLEASDENEVIEPVLCLVVEMVGADGASFVPLDEHGQPQTALSHGVLPVPVMESWVEYLASTGVRERCRSCELKDILGKPENCPLLNGPFSNSAGLLCLPVQRGEREFGILTLFSSRIEWLDERTRTFLQILMDETALGLEGVRLRRRELAALRQMQILRQQTDLSALLTGLLENVHSTLEADFASLIVPQLGRYHPRVDLVLGDFPSQARPFVDGVLQGVMTSGEPVLLGDVAGDPSSTPGIRSLVGAPLMSSNRQVVGAVLVGNQREQGFHQRQLALLQTVAGQIALVVGNANLMAELEYKTMIQERVRLAREIHDGLAQTLGFLKLQVAQMRSYLTRGEIERVQQNVQLCYETLTEAYQDARQAIDDLRVSPTGWNLDGWLAQTVSEFQELSGLSVEMHDVGVRAKLPPEIHAQLIRIVQEALSNVRKHAKATQVWVTCREISNDLILEVRDDGDGFCTEDVSGPSQYGLRGMRERAELIGADFQVISRPQEGTTVRVHLPLLGLDMEEVVS